MIITEPTIEFHDATHSYYNVDTGEKYISVTTLLKKYEEPTDWNQVAINYAKKNGFTAQYWLDVWEKKKNDAATAGTAYHSEREDNFERLEKEGKTVVTNKLKNGIKRSIPLNTLSSGVYSELLLYHPFLPVAGQADEVRIRDWEVYINDFKTSNKIEFESFCHPRYGHKMLTGILSHLMDCNGTKFSLQTSMYMYFLELRGFIPTKLSIEHTKDNNKKHFLPYLRDEVIAILNEI